LAIVDRRRAAGRAPRHSLPDTNPRYVWSGRSL